MHMPLTPEENLIVVSKGMRVASNFDVLDQLLGLDIAHAMDTGNTITINESASGLKSSLAAFIGVVSCIPNGQDAASLRETCLLRDTTDALFKDGGYFGRTGFRLSVASGLGRCDVLCGWEDGAALSDIDVSYVMLPR